MTPASGDTVIQTEDQPHGCTTSVRHTVVWTATATVAGGMLVAWMFNFFNGMILGRSWPFSSFLFDPGDRFADFVNIARLPPGGNPYSYEFMVYFPFTNLLLRPFFAIPPAAGVFIICVVAVGATLLLFMSSTRTLGSWGQRFVVAQVFLASYPILFAADRANLEIFVYALLAGFAVQWVRGSRGTATVMLSGAIAMKGSPLVFLVFLLPREHRRYLFACLGLVAVGTLAGLAIIRAGMFTSLSAFLSDLSFYNHHFAMGDAGHAFGNSLFGGAKSAVDLLFGDEARRAFASSAFRPWTLVAATAHAGAMLYLFRRNLEFWRAMTVLVCVSLLFMPVSADYRLLWILVPCALFLSESARTKMANERLIAVLFGLVLVPKGFSFFPWSDGPTVATNLSAVLSPVLIAALLAAVLVSGNRDVTVQRRQDRETGELELCGTGG